MPRVSRQQQHRSNPDYTSTKDYFKKTVVIPFLDHLISDISSRFAAHAKQAATIEQLLPTNITTNTTCMCIQEAVDFYKDDLPNTSILDEELCRWKCKWLTVPLNDRPNILSESLKQCCPHTLKKIFFYCFNLYLHVSTTSVSSFRAFQCSILKLYTFLCMLHHTILFPFTFKSLGKTHPHGGKLFYLTVQAMSLKRGSF